MSVPCPCCGRPMASIPVDVLNEAPLTKQMRSIVNVLVKAYPRDVGFEAIWDALYGLDPNGGPDNPNGVVAVQMWRARQQLKPLGWTISSGCSGRGRQARYRLVSVEAGDAG